MTNVVKVFGHPLHQILIVFPLGLLSMSVIFDALYFIQKNPDFGIASYYMLSAGLIGGLCAAVFGLLDWLNVPKNTRAKTIGAWHGIGNVMVVLLFGLSWFVRKNLVVPDSGSFVLAVAGFVLAAFTGWLGGELVNRLGIGVDEGANPNAPSSLKTHDTHYDEWRHSH
jgi:uncharacterized membrane protein